MTSSTKIFKASMILIVLIKKAFSEGNNINLDIRKGEKQFWFQDGHVNYVLSNKRLNVKLF